MVPNPMFMPKCGNKSHVYAETLVTDPCSCVEMLHLIHLTSHTHNHMYILKVIPPSCDSWNSIIKLSHLQLV